tara:strand:+ start:471 stop:746 length:276 start_codon:yes stop_codon:yes gene_type:complete
MISILNWLFGGSCENETEKEKEQEKIRKNAVKTIERFYINLMQKRKLCVINDENMINNIADFKNNLPKEKKTEKKRYNRKRRRVYKEGKLD